MSGAAEARLPPLIGLFGGTFDPIHLGHLQLAEGVLGATPMAELRLIPARVPPHRPSPKTRPEDRVALIEAALTNRDPRLRLDRREICREGPSYMVDTLDSLRAELGDDRPLALILGADAFLGLERWSRWRRLPRLCHLIVLARSGSGSEPVLKLAQKLGMSVTADPAQLTVSPAGTLLPLPLTEIDCSSTLIRERLKKGTSVAGLTPPEVLWEIRRRGLYGVPPCQTQKA